VNASSAGGRYDDLRAAALREAAAREETARDDERPPRPRREEELGMDAPG
jgi:hypothetical protein